MSDRRGARARVVVDVAELVCWAYVEQRVDHAETGWDMPRGWLGVGDSARRAAEVGALGAIVDTSRNMGFAVHPDAMAVERAVLRIADRAARALVMQHARGGSRVGPWWCPDVEFGRYAPVRKAGGQLVYLREDGRRVACALEPPMPSWEIRAFARAQYARWWHGLAEVAVALRARPEQLVAHQVVGPEAPREPWAAVRRGVDSARKI